MAEDIKSILAATRDRMSKSVDSTHNEFGTMRAGRANPQMLDRIYVNYYGASTPLNQLANISAPEPRVLTITPYDQNVMKEVEKAIADSDLGLSPAIDGNVLRLVIPELNEDRRKELVRQVRNQAEEGRVAIRNIRRDMIQDVKKLQKDSAISEDEGRDAESEIQKITDDFVSRIDKALEGKEQELLEV